jgi:EAL domain-containing protein (putative c-di-GMP-specific phosphodiesterase class I)
LGSSASARAIQYAAFDRLKIDVDMSQGAFTEVIQQRHINSALRLATSSLEPIYERAISL